MIKTIKENYIIISIIVFAFLLRIIGITYGFPLVLIYDEAPTLLAALKMIGTHSLRANAVGYYYPPLLSYVSLPFIIVFLVIGKITGYFTNIAQIKEIVLLNYGIFLPILRLVSVTLGTATVYLVYKISRLLFENKRIAWLAALFLSVSFFHASNSHLGQTWTAQTFFIVLVLYWSVRMYKNTAIKISDYVVSGLLIIMAFGINFVGIISYFWFFLAHMLRVGFINWKQGILHKYLWLTNIVILLGVAFLFYLNPAGLNNYFHRIADTSSPAIMGGGGVASYRVFHLSFLQIFWFYLKNIFLLEPIFFATACAGAIFLVIKEKLNFFFLGAWALLYILMLSGLTLPMARYALPFIPLAALLAAYFIVTASKIFKVSKRLYIIIVAILVGYPLVLDILFNARMAKNDTRVQAREWIIANIENNAVIDNMSLSSQLNLMENITSIEYLNSNNPGLASSRTRYLQSLDEGDYPHPAYFLINYPIAASATPIFDYMIKGGYSRSKLNTETDKIKDGYSLVASFSAQDSSSINEDQEMEILEVPFNASEFSVSALFHFFDYYGPYIEIYKRKQ